MNTALVIGLLLALIVGIKTDSIILAVIAWVVCTAAVYFILKLLHSGMDKGFDKASDALSKLIDKKKEGK